MNAIELEAKFRELFEKDLAKMRQKNHDYAGNGNDALKNLKRWGSLGVIVRLSDKYERLENFFKTGILKVKDESIRDTLLDIRVYGYLAEILLDEEQAEK